MNKLSISVTVIGLIVGALIGYALHGSRPSFGAATDCGSNTCLTSLYDSGTLAVGGATTLTGSFALGSSGTAQSAQIAGTCTASVPVDAFVASTTAHWTCVDSAVLAGDRIVATFSNPTLGIGSFAVTGAIATSSGQFDVSVQNQTGSATSSIGSAYKKINYFITR